MPASGTQIHNEAQNLLLLQDYVHRLTNTLRTLEDTHAVLGGLCPGASKLKCKSGASFGVHLVGQEITKDELARLKRQRSDLRKAMRENRKAAKNAAKRKKRLVKALSMQIYAVQRNLSGSRSTICLLKLVYGPCGQRM